MVESTAKLRQEIMALSGIDIMSDENTFKSTYQIMDELSQKWESLTDIQRASITELVAGKHQGNIMSALMSNFDTAREALNTSLDSSGSAMAEHAKWSESLEARLNKLKSAWQSLSLTFMNSDFLKIGIDLLSGFVNILDEIIDKLGTFGTIGLGVAITGIVKNFATLKTIFTSLITKTEGAAIGFKALASSTSAVVGGIGLLVAGIGLAINLYKNYREEISKARQETISASDEFLDAAGSFEQAYIKYSGKTSLTEEEEAELTSAINGTVDALDDKSSALQNIVSGSNDYIDSLEAIAQAEIKAAESAAKAKKTAAEKELKEAAIGWEGFDGSEVNIQFGSSDGDEVNKIAEKIGSKYWTKTTRGNQGQWSGGFVLDSNADANEIIDYYNMLIKYQEALSDAGLTDTSAYDNTTKAIDKLTDSIGVYTDSVYDAAKAQYQLEHGIPKTAEAYLEMRKAILSDMKESGSTFDTRKDIAASLDKEYGQIFDLTTSKIQSQKLIGVLDEFGDAEALQMEAFLDMKTSINNDECSVGDYISQFDDINKMTEGWSDQAKEELKLSFGLDTDTVKKQYDDLLKDLPEKIGDKTAEDFLGGLSKSELSAVYSLKGEIDWVNGSPSEILAQVEEQARLNEAMSFTFSIELQTESIEALNTALSESRSATGLTSESLSLLKSRYEDLEGFNAAALFENTALGVRLNNEELVKLESQYETVNKLDIDKNLNTLAAKYKELTSEIKSCTDEKKKEELQLKADNYADKIEELSTLASMYDGLTSSFSKWQAALSSPNNGDNYDAIFDNFEKVKELYDGGLVGTDDFKTFAQLMTDEDLSGAGVDAFVSAYKNGLPVMKKYFTEGQNGCKRFLKDISNINSEWAHLNDDGNWEIDFNIEDVAKELGISADAVLLIVEKLRDFGFEVKIDDTSLENLQTEIEKNEAKLKELGQKPYPVNLDIEANAENINKIESEIDGIVAEIAKVNGSTVSPEIKTAQLDDLRAKLEVLIQKKQEASQPTFMKLDTSQVKANLVDALEKVQTYQTALNELNKLNELKEAGISIDDSEISAAQEKINECAKAIQGLDEDVKVAIGLEENASIDSIKKAFEDGKVTIDANTDPAATKIERLVKEVDKIEDKDVTINVTVKGLDDVKELNRNIDLATNIDGDIDSLSKYVENAKALNELGSNITTYVTANVKGNVLETAEFKLNNLKVFSDSVKELKDVGSSVSSVEANVKGNVINTEEYKINNLKTFSESAKDVDDIGDVSSEVTANISGNVINTPEYKINNLKTFSDNAKDIKGIDVKSNIEANITGNVTSMFEEQIDNLKVYAENASEIRGIGDVSSSVEANITGNVTGMLEMSIDNLKVYSDSAKDVESIGDVSSSVDANITGNVASMLEVSIDNLKAYSESAKDVNGIGNVSSSVEANISGNVASMLEASIDNLKVYSDSAKNVADIGDVSSSVTANVNGNVKNLFEEQIDNLKVYAESAKDIEGVGDVSSSVTADIDGDVIDTFEYKIDNLKVYSESAKDIHEIGDVSSSVTADVNGNVIETSESKISSLKTYSDSAKNIDGVGDVSSSVTANVEGNVVETAEYRIDNLKEYSDSAKNVSDIGSVTSSVTANIDGNVVDTAEYKINNLKEYSESAKNVDDIGDVTSKVTANIEGNVVETAEYKIDNLKKYSDSAKDVESIGDVESSVTADVNGNVIETAEYKINNLEVYGESAKKAKSIGTVTTSVTADVNGSVLNTAESKIDNIGVFADNAKKAKDVGNFSSSVSANVNGNIVTDDTAITDLEHFVSIVGGLQNQTVAVNVTANVDSANINQAITLLKGVSDSGVFKNYTATVQVGAKIAKIDDTVIQNYQAPEKDGKAVYTVDSTDVDSWTAPDKTGTVNYSAEVEALTDAQKHKTGTITYSASIVGLPTATGTANAEGSTSGRAFARGDWGIKGNGVALGGELGRELVVRDGKFFTIGDEGAEFFRYKKNDIVFNAAQTESLFKYGGIKGANPRGKMLASGSAFAEGSNGKAFAYVSKKESGNNVSGTGGFINGNSSGGSSSGSGSGGGSSSKEDKEFEEVIDWIEIIIDRVERAIDKFDQQANNIYKSWTARNNAIISQTSKVQEEIELQQKAYDRYIKQANSVGLSESYAKKVRDGTIDIQTITDEDLKEKIDDYQQWYNKALDCQDAIEELKETEASLYQQRFENVSTQYEGILGTIEHEKNMLEEYINQSETQGWLVSYNYYRELSSNEKRNIAELEKQKADMVAEFNAAMDSGTITKGSEAYYEMVNAIDEVSLSIEQANTRVMEISQTAQQLKWEQFDLLQDKISAITEETEFLIELMSSDKLFDDNGQLTDSGMATMGQHGVAYNVLMQQADQAREEAERLERERARALYDGTDTYDQDLEERYQEMIALQREYILAAEDQKEAIRDLVEEGIQLELDALDEKIEKYKDSLDSARDLYEYNKKVKEQSKEIASLEKQRAAYLGDVSEEGKAKLQKIEVSLEEAKTELYETEMDKMIDNTSTLLDELYLEYEEILNTRLDNIDALISDMIVEINANASAINGTISEKSDSVGYVLSDSMESIWNTNSGKINSVITTYGEKFSSAQTTTNNALSTINSNLQSMISQLNTIAKTNIKSASVSSAKNYAVGKYDFSDDEDAWTQDGGKEFIVRPSDGAILTPIAKGDSVLTSVASRNIWDMANSPAEFIKDNLKLDTSNVPNGTNVHSSYTQHLEKVVFNFPNVKNYDDMLSAMQKDRNFERLINSITIDQIAGKSSLGKGKSIR